MLVFKAVVMATEADGGQIKVIATRSQIQIFLHYKGNRSIWKSVKRKLALILIKFRGAQGTELEGNVKRNENFCNNGKHQAYL